MQPLAFKLRPQTIDDIVGQDHLVGKNGVIRKLLTNNKIPSMILYGHPGIGKTTIATCIVNTLNRSFATFNASTDNKAALKKACEDNDDNIILIVDEIHRMKKDIQDYLLPYVEKGKVTMIGITTVNPYHSVNPAIRSRCNVFKLNPLNENDLINLIDKVTSFINPKYCFSNKAKEYLAHTANGEARSLINMVELIDSAYANLQNPLTLEITDIQDIIQKPIFDYDKNGDSYYETLSGLHKSIRGSDVNASLHYLGKLIYAEDFLPLIRRLYCIAYEDISLANPSIGPKVKAACEAALELGMPEAVLPLSSIVVEMALSPKSNSTYLAMEKAMADIEQGKGGHLPPHLKNTYSFDGKYDPYKYPHDYPNSYVKQQYLPDILKDKKYYSPGNNITEEKFREYLNKLK